MQVPGYATTNVQCDVCIFSRICDWHGSVVQLSVQLSASGPYPCQPPILVKLVSHAKVKHSSKEPEIDRTEYSVREAYNCLWCDKSGSLRPSAEDQSAWWICETGGDCKKRNDVHEAQKAEIEAGCKAWACRKELS